MNVAAALLIDEVRKHPDGRVDLIGLFEDIYLDSVPVTMDEIALYVDLALSNSDRGVQHSLEFQLVDPFGNAVGEPTRVRFGVPPQSEFPRDSAQLDLTLFALTFHRFGAYAIEIRCAGEILRRVPLYVNAKSDLGQVPGAQEEFDSSVER